MVVSIYIQFGGSGYQSHVLKGKRRDLSQDRKRKRGILYKSNEKSQLEADFDALS